MFPRLNIDLNKMYINTKYFVDLCEKNNMDLMTVTKSFCADIKIVEKQVEAGAKYLADSRIKNLIRMKDMDALKVLIRIPMQSEIKDVIKYSDISFNSELTTILKLNDEAKKQNKIHKILVMLDLGDLREGILPENIEDVVKKIVILENIKIVGFGVNLTCYGGIIPSEKNLTQLVSISSKLEKEYNLNLEIISGGNSSSLFLLDGNGMPNGVNNLRLGEAIVLGRETAYGNDIEGTYNDIFVLEAEVVELKTKGSIPIGEIGMDAFGNKPTFDDCGNILRGIVAVGQQDLNYGGLMPFDKDIIILGASSDHLLLNLENTNKAYKVGDTIKFRVDYGALLKLTTSEYIDKNYI
ncbi:MAG: ornithine racemase Orr [Bacillota bacterium]|nr:ornithine racemase Orr [Bacillota bacterium]